MGFVERVGCKGTHFVEDFVCNFFADTVSNTADAFHNIVGETYAIWPARFTMEDLPVNDDKLCLATLNDFANGKWKSKKWVNDYCMVSFGDLEEIELVIKTNIPDGSSRPRDTS